MVPSPFRNQTHARGGVELFVVPPLSTAKLAQEVESIRVTVPHCIFPGRSENSGRKFHFFSNLGDSTRRFVLRVRGHDRWIFVKKINICEKVQSKCITSYMEQIGWTTLFYQHGRDYLFKKKQCDTVATQNTGSCGQFPAQRRERCAKQYTSTVSN